MQAEVARAARAQELAEEELNQLRAQLESREEQLDVVKQAAATTAIDDKRQAEELSKAIDAAQEEANRLRQRVTTYESEAAERAKSPLGVLGKLMGAVCVAPRKPQSSITSINSPAEQPSAPAPEPAADTPKSLPSYMLPPPNPRRTAAKSVPTPRAEQ